MHARTVRICDSCVHVCTCRANLSLYLPLQSIHVSTFPRSRALSVLLSHTLPVCLFRFETAEMIRKVFMTAIIVFISDPDARLGVGFLASFFSLLVVYTCRPFVDPRLDTLMIAALVTQTLTLSCLSLSLVPPPLSSLLSLFFCASPIDRLFCLLV